MSLPDILIQRFRVIPEAMRSAGRSAEWYWTYVVCCDGTCDAVCSHVIPNGQKVACHDVGRGLRDARDVAARIAKRVGASHVVEDWAGGKAFKFGPRGGLVPVVIARAS